MSRIGKKPVPLPDGVQVTLQDSELKVTGPKGELTWRAPAATTVTLDAQARLVRVTRASDSRQDKALHGLTRALIANMVAGVTQGYQRGLEIYGTGYNCKLDGRKLLLNLGFSGRGVGRPAQFVIDIPEGLQVEVLVAAARGDNEPAKLMIRGIDKWKVGQFAAEVRSLRKPEPYRGKGIRYVGEQIKRKAGKAFAGGAT